jgi:hypothetical protein
MNRKKRRASTIRRLHRSLGAAAAVFILFMVLSGMVINHSNGLGLDQRHVSQPYILGWYGLDAPDQIHSFSARDNWISFAGSQLFLDDSHISSVSNGVGAVFSNNMLIAASNDELLLLDSSGQLIERQPWSPPEAGPIESIGLLPDGTVVVKSTGQLWLADAELLGWQAAEETISNPIWSASELAPLPLIQTITQQYRGEGLSVERVLLDFHSGHIFGPIGVFVYDLLALAVGFLSVSGLVLWIRGRRNGKRCEKVR